MFKKIGYLFLIFSFSIAGAQSIGNKELATLDADDLSEFVSELFDGNHIVEIIQTLPLSGGSAIKLILKDSKPVNLKDGFLRIQFPKKEDLIGRSFALECPSDFAKEVFNAIWYASYVTVDFDRSYLAETVAEAIVRGLDDECKVLADNEAIQKFGEWYKSLEKN